MKKVLVTGGAGFIGSLLIRKLIKMGYKVVVVDKLYFGKGPIAELEDQATLIKADIRNLTKGVFANIDMVVHLAALSNDPMSNFAPDLNEQVNTVATEKIAKQAKQEGVKRFIFASSCSIYNQRPHNSILHTETSKVDPQEYYSRSKLLAEQAILGLSDNNFKVVVLRKGTVVGKSPRMRFDLVVNTMVKTALTLKKIVVYDGRQHRPLIDVRDVVEAYMLVIKAKEEQIENKIFNVLNKNYKMLPLAEIVAEVLQERLNEKFPIEVQAGVKDRSYRVSGELIKTHLKFKPLFEMNDSVAEIVSYVSLRPKINFTNSKYYNILRMKQIMEGFGK